MNQHSLNYRLRRRLRSIPADFANRIINLPTIERRLLREYEAELELYRSSLPVLSAQDAAIVRGLNEQGVYVTTLDDLGWPAQEMWDQATSLARIYGEKSSGGLFKDRYTIQVDADDLMQNLEIVRWPLNDRILNIVESYLGVPAGYDTLNFFYTVADGKQVAARRWHRDLEDRRMVKVAVYLHDVDIDTGPFEVLHHKLGNASNGRNYPVFTQEMIEGILSRPLLESDVTTCVGKAGTVIFVDSASFYHRGRPATARDRSALFYNFFSHTPLRPFFCHRHGFSRQQISQIANGLSPRAQRCLLWHEDLHWIAKLVPPAPL